MAYVPTEQDVLFEKLRNDLSDASAIGVARPGNTIIVTFLRRLNMQEIDNMRDVFERLFPELKIAILDEVDQIFIIQRRPDELA